MMKKMVQQHEIPDVDWRQLHESRGCPFCKYSDKSLLFTGPVCTFSGQLDIDEETGECKSQRKDDSAGGR